MEIDQLITKLKNKESLNINQTKFLFNKIMDGEIDDDKISKILIGLAEKGENSDEITGGASVLREKSLKVKISSEALDMCGTGGDGKHTLNISTAASIVLASLGIKVAKHGNKGLTSKCGSADVLEKLGININKNPDAVASDIENKNFGFMFAPIYHETMKKVAKVRKELKRRTIFNLLGPLCNPASVKNQCIGIFSKDLLPLYAESLIKLKTNNAWVYHSQDGLDEISIFDKTDVLEIKNNSIKKFTINPNDFINQKFKFEEIIGGDANFNASKIIDLFKGQDGAFLEIVSLNCAAGLLVMNKNDNLKNAYQEVKNYILSGSVLKTLESLRS